MAFLKIFRYYNFAGFARSLKEVSACYTKFFHSDIESNTSYNMRTAYFQHSEGEEIVRITVKFSESNINKVFNFERNILEKLVDFLKKLDNRVCDMWNRKKKKINAEQILPLSNSILLLNNEEVSDNLIFQDIFQSDFSGDLKLRILDSDYEVLINAPKVTKIELPKTLQVGCIVGPDVYKAENADFKQSDFIWYRSKFPQKQNFWEKCGEGVCYEIKEGDCDYYLKLSCTPKLNEKVGPVVDVISKTAVVKMDNLNLIFKRLEFTKEKAKENECRIVSYNILADMYVHTKEAKTQIFTFCKPEYLEFGYRKNLLVAELQGYNADILCLQEVERKFFHGNLLMFNELGYEGLYSEKEGTREGCAIFFDRKKFDLLTSNEYVFTKELLNNPLLQDIKLQIENNRKLIERLVLLTSQIQVTVLKCISDNILVIGNVHFYFHPDADHIRLLQGVTSLRILLNAIEEIREKEPNKKISLVICGDFNTTPECGFHQLLSKGSIDSSHSCWTSNKNEIIEGVSFSHSLKMRSCYDHNIFTNYTPSFKACIDYIYFQCDHLELKQSVPVPSDLVLSQFEGIPSEYFPSDHVALVADLKFKDDSDE